MAVKAKAQVVTIYRAQFSAHYRGNVEKWDGKIESKKVIRAGDKLLAASPFHGEMVAGFVVCRVSDLEPRRTDWRETRAEAVADLRRKIANKVEEVRDEIKEMEEKLASLKSDFARGKVRGAEIIKAAL